MFGGWNAAKAETQVRLCNARIKLQKNKRTLVTKQMRKEVAELLRTGKQEYARIRVEGVIRENLLMQAYEILELYLELVAVRSQLIAKTKEIPRDMVEAISSIIYAAQRISDIPELVNLRALFASKYGKEYAAEAGGDVGCTKWQVNANLIRCLLVEPPLPEDKLQMLSEIAQEHGVEWDLSAAARDLLPPGTPTPPGLLGAGQSHKPPPGGPKGPSGGGGQLPAHMAAQPAPPGGYDINSLDPQQAAVAAAAAAAHARAMADRAAELAALHAELGGSSHAPGQQHLPGSSSSGAPHVPPVAWDNGPPAGVPGVGMSRPGPSQPAGPPPPLGRSTSDIQRAYDAAVGPPVKGGPSAPYPTSAPSPPRNGGLPSVPAQLPDPPTRDADPHVPNLPRPPQGIPGEPQEDEYDELTRRLDALKRS